MAETGFGKSVIYGVGLQGAQPPQPANNLQGAQQSQPANDPQGAQQAQPENDLQGAEQSQPENNQQGAEQSQPENNQQGTQQSQADDDPPDPPPPPPQGDATPGAGLPRRRPGAPRALLLAALAVAALFWLLSLPLTCPMYVDEAACPRPRAASPRARHDGGTAMFASALGWANYYQRAAGQGDPTDTILTRKESDAIAKDTDRLASGASEMEDAFTRSDKFEAEELDALEARLYRARDDVQYFADAKWPRLAGLACLPCGYFPLTLPCPSHPVAVVRREAEAVAKVLFLIDKRHWRVLKQHEDVQAGALDPTRDGVCGVSDRLSNVNVNRGGQRGMRRLLDFRSAAFGVCSLTSREQDEARRFRERGAYAFKGEWEELMSRVNDITSKLDDAYLSLSWRRGHIDVGVKAIGDLLDVVSGRR